MDRRNFIISGLLFGIVVLQILILAPRDLDMRDLKASLGPSDQGLAKAQKTVRSTSHGMASAVLSGALSGAPGQIMNDVNSVGAKPEGKEWELWAKRAVQPKGSPEWAIEDVKVKFFASNGVTYNVTGKRGGVDPDKIDIWIKGSVETKTSNGYTFRSESVYYDSVHKKLTTKDPVEMTGPKDADGSRLDLTGEDLLADLNTNDLRVNRNVRARKRVHGERTAMIQSDSALFSGRSNSASFLGSVIIDVETMRITGPEAKFQYDSKKDIVESVLVAGGVKVTDSDKLATSGSLSVFFRDDKYVFKGSPRVVQNDDELVGDEIVFLDGGKRVQVLNAKAQIDPARLDEKNNKQKGTGR